MSLTNKLLSNIFFGTELEKLEISLSKMASALGYLSADKATDLEPEKLISVVKDFFRKKHIGRFGGCIK